MSLNSNTINFMSSAREREKREETVKEMKERDTEERGTGIKVKKLRKQKTFPHLHLPATRPYPTVNQYQLDAPVP